MKRPGNGTLALPAACPFDIHPTLRVNSPKPIHPRRTLLRTPSRQHFVQILFAINKISAGGRSLQKSGSDRAAHRRNKIDAEVTANRQDLAKF